MKRCLIEHPKYQLSTAQNHNFYFTLSRISIIRKRISVTEDEEKRGPLYTDGENVNVYNHYLEALQKIINKYDPVVLLLEVKVEFERDNCMPIFIAVFFTTVGYGNNLCAHLQVNKENVHITQP